MKRKTRILINLVILLSLLLTPNLARQIRAQEGAETESEEPSETPTQLFLPIIQSSHREITTTSGDEGASAIAPLVLDQIAAKEETTFWVILRQQADLSAASTIGDRTARGRYVYQQLTTTADISQGRLRALLRSRGANHKPFWIVNSIRVKGNKALLRELAAQPEVLQIAPERIYQIPPTQPGQGGVATTEWNLDRIRATEAWATFGVRGEGIVVANIDTGAQFDHPALVAQYRGNLGNGAFDHNYNWYDPSQVCGVPSLVPCDNNAHGTHTMGTMVGDDNPGANQIGVAPRARWMAAKGCESNSCSSEALLATGQWLLAPTDLNGNNPRPDLRPHIINNSWGSGPGDPFYQSIVGAWLASGIFPAFSNGNAGPSCGSASSPGDFVETYSAGAFDIDNNIADFSARGPSAFSGIKPNLAAPGVNVRSSVPGGSYAYFDGTSMAAPHVAGTVALMWSAAPTLIGDIAATRALLDQSAIDTADLSCGGTPENNNVWGEGRLDAFAAVERSPRGPTGTLQGVVTDSASGAPIAGATVTVAGPVARTTHSDGAGAYSFILPVGVYEVNVGTFGYFGQTASGVALNENATTQQAFALNAAPTYAVSGYVRDNSGQPVANATLTLLGTPLLPVASDAGGFYSFASVPVGEYALKAAASGCNDAQIEHLIVDSAKSVDFVLPQRLDAYGYFCQVVASNYVEANTVLPLSGDDGSTPVSLPFPFTLYGRTYNTAYVSTNGALNFLAPNASFSNDAIPNRVAPNAAIYPFWDDLAVDEEASVRTELVGAAPNRQFVIEWRNVALLTDLTKRMDFEAILYENGYILTQYRNIADDNLERGGEATLGIEDDYGLIAFQFALNQPAVSSPAFSVLYLLPPSGFVQGSVTDANDQLPVAGAVVRALQNGNQVRAGTTDANGFFRLQVPIGAYTLEASAIDYNGKTAPVNVALDQTVTQDFVLSTARAELSPAALQFIVSPGQTKVKSIALRNEGQADLVFSISEANAVVPTARALASQVGANSRTAPAGYTPQTVATTGAGGRVLVFMDALPWGSEALLQVLTANGIAYDVANSTQMGAIDLAMYEVVFLANDQPSGFYASYNDNLTYFANYVERGGLLWVGAAAWGWNEGDFNGGQLPGGVTVQGPRLEALNDVLESSHPLMQGVPNPFSGTEASHASFVNLPAGTTIIAQGRDSGLPTLIEYFYGAGRVLAFGQPFDFSYREGQDPGRILENGVPYAYAFEPGVDIPWLAENPVEGTLPPGGVQTIQVSVDATGLAPGVYQAKLFIRSNSGRKPILQVPVTLIVTDYNQGVNAGGNAYIDVAGEAWAADKPYAAGSWGYSNPKSRTTTVRVAIAGTEDDPLYQTQRLDALEYRFDSLPAGVYQVELRFAELQKRKPGQHLFDVIIEGNMLLPAHDMMAEKGGYTADDHLFFVPVTDGQLNIRLVERRSYGQPVINAIRVIRRPDR